MTKLNLQSLYRKTNYLEKLHWSRSLNRPSPDCCGDNIRAKDTNRLVRPSSSIHFQIVLLLYCYRIIYFYFTHPYFNKLEINVSLAKSSLRLSAVSFSLIFYFSSALLESRQLPQLVAHAQFFRSASKSLNKHKYESKFLRFYF